MSMEMWTSVVQAYADIRGISNDAAARIIIAVIRDFNNGLLAKEV